jgi:hypothetical protein
VNAERISKGLMPANQQITIREVSNEVGISYGSAQASLTMQHFFAGSKSHSCQNHHIHHTLQPVTFGFSVDYKWDF